MFKRILMEDWAVYVPIISFVLIAGVFVAATIRALRLSKDKREHLASLPLEDSPPHQSSHPSQPS